MNTQKKRLSEKLALAGIVLLTFLLLFASIRFERHVHRQKVMFYELQLLRTSVRLFKAIEHRDPETLRELANGNYRFPDEPEQRRFLEYVPAVNEQGQICDPFGTPYNYAQSTGWVRSATSGYEFW